MTNERSLQAAGHASRGTTSIEIVLSSNLHALLLVAITTFHAICAVYLVHVARLYWFLDDPFMEFFANNLASRSTRRLGLWGSFFMAIGVMHSVEALLLITRGIRRVGRSCRPGRSVVPQSIVSLVSSSRLEESLRAVHKVQSAPSAWLRPIFGQRGVLGIEGQHFYTFYYTREGLEIISQCFQLHRFSTLIARRWINDVSVLLAVANCWLTPLLHHYFHRHHGRERLACIICGGILATISGMILPVVIMLPTVKRYRRDVDPFPVEMMYDDVQFISFVMENQSLFALSTLDGISKIVPHISIYMCLRTLRGCLREKCASGSFRRESGKASVLGSRSSTTRQREQRRLKPLDGTIWRRVGTVLIHAKFMTIGAAILFFHFRAIRTQGEASLHRGCRQILRPWFASKVACSIYEFNCVRENVSTPDPRTFLTHLDESTLAALIITHCPQLVMTGTFRNFSNLRTLEIWNATLVDWDVPARIDPDENPNLSYLAMVYVNMSELPPGILQPLPPMLGDIEIIHANITTLPTDLHKTWPTVSILYLEHIPLGSFPETLLEMDIYDLSLTDDGITSMEKITLTKSHVFLSLCGNPLTELSANINSQASFDFLVLENSNIAKLPAWVNDHVREGVFGYGAPICADNGSDGLATPPLISCAPNARIREGRYPLWLMASLRPV